MMARSSLTLSASAADFSAGSRRTSRFPSQAVEFKKQDNTWTPILYMSKDAVQQAPRQKFDGMMWVPTRTLTAERRDG